MNLLASLCLVGACASGSSVPQRDSSSVSPPARTATRELTESLLDGAAGTNTPVAVPSASPFELPSAAILSSRAQGRASTSTSLGSPSNGSLVGGVALPAGVAGIRFNERRNTGARFATVEVIATIMNAAQAVRARFAESELTVNDLSLPEGGRIAHHGSHRAGRDADILFYLRGDDGNATESVGAPIDLDGIGFDFKELHDEHDDVRVHFDAERTWLLHRGAAREP